MLPNEEFALACRAYYDKIGLSVDATNGEFAHSPLTKKECDTGYYLLHGHHQHQGLLQSKDLGKCCFFVGDVKRWLEGLDCLPENYFELWDIYEQYSGDNGRRVMERLHKEKDENGKSLVAVEMGKKTHGAKDENGKSLHNLNLHKEKDENGKSLAAVRLNEKIHKEKDENGKSLHAVEAGKRGAEKTNEAKDENGKSLIAVKGAMKTHEAKDENGKSLHAVKGSKKANAQVWESTIDGFRSNAGNVARHNRANGWDPNARTRVG
jgi:hypothetical protein